MDVWFCRDAGTDAERHTCVMNILEMMACALSRACPEYPCLRLTNDLHGCRQLGHLAAHGSHPNVWLTRRSVPKNAQQMRCDNRLVNSNAIFGTGNFAVMINDVRVRSIRGMR